MLDKVECAVQHQFLSLMQQPISMMFVPSSHCCVICCLSEKQSGGLQTDATVLAVVSWPKLQLQLRLYYMAEDKPVHALQTLLAAGLLQLRPMKPRTVGLIGVIASVMNCYMLYPKLPAPALAPPKSYAEAAQQQQPKMELKKA